MTTTVDTYKVRLVDQFGNPLVLPASLGQKTQAQSVSVVPASDWGAFDATNKLRVSGYGKASAAGDTPILVTAAGRQQVAGGGTLQVTGIGGPTGITDNSDNVRALGTMGYIYTPTVWDAIRTPNKFIDINTVAIGSIATIWTPVAGKKFRLMGGIISVSAAVSVLFEDNAGGSFILRLPKLLVDTPFQFTLGGNGFLSAAANNVLKATSSGAANLIGTVYGTEE